MSWNWMSVKQTLEEELTLERQIRSIHNVEDVHALQELCSGLTRQAWHQSKLLSQAVKRIAEIEADEMMRSV
jgi:hypothetical protein|tara:strand:- start:542 stop:757 length:216 start_codon:yes stop_codon:yes gene_type:complete